MTRYVVPPLRRCVQVLSILVLLLLPLLALYTHYKAAHALGDLPAGRWQSLAVEKIDRVVGESKQRQQWVDQTQGTFWSARLCGFSLSDPLAGAEAIVSSRSFYRPLLWSLLVPVVVSVLLGRVFCGWICPMNTLLELVDKCRRLLRVAEIRERDVKFSRANKYVLLAAGLGFVAIMSVPFLAMVFPPAVLSREFHVLVFGSGIGMGVYFILAICMFELFVSKRWWCRYVCPGGALYSLLGQFRLVRVRRDEEKCIECADCVRTCQFDLRPMLAQTTGMECTNCASCISGCKSNALSYSFVLPIAGPTGRNRSPQAPSDDETKPAPRSASTVLNSLIIAVALTLFTTPAAQAHHILGLPHYSYKENYPQAPTLEYPATTGPYDVLMTTYPGVPVPGEAATVAFYIKDRNTNRPYAQPVTVQVLETFTFGENRVIFPSATHQPFDNQHKYTVTFPDDGEYIVELTMDVEDQTEVIPFLIVAGNPTATTSVIASLAGGLAIFLVIVRAVKKKRDRRNRSTTDSPAQDSVTISNQ